LQTTVWNYTVITEKLLGKRFVVEHVAHAQRLLPLPPASIIILMPHIHSHTSDNI
jgi:hypothetical protein